MRVRTDTAGALALLLALLALAHGAAAASSHGAAAASHEVARGICSSVEVRNSATQLHRLRGCRVIEGQLSIVLMEHTNASDFDNVSFPELREVTGYIKIYRVKGVINLGDMFPNLSVVRGMQLFKDFAIVIFDNMNLESLGLRSLQVIERGAVRIQHNDQLCYTNTIDWARIMPADAADNSIIRNNYDDRLCGLCPNAQSRIEDRRPLNTQCPADSSGRLLCWDDRHCQKVCPIKCGDRGCLSDGLCCHSACLGGCDALGPEYCHVCRNFSFGYGPARKCMTKCPAGTYQLFRRCVTEQECRSMPPVQPEPNPAHGSLPPPSYTYKILNDTCVYICPSGYMERREDGNETCQPCPPSGCVRECSGGKVDSVTSAEQFRGCTHVKGSLEISLRAGSAVAAQLESSLGEIREIDGGLIVIRSYPLVSLMFLKNLQRIHGKTYDNRSLHIFSNPNLELLWDWKTHKPIEILKGKLFIHFNQKLCYDVITPLKQMTVESDFSETEVSNINNGDKGSCFKAQLTLEFQGIRQHTVFLKWDQYCPEDLRKLLGYSIYYIVAEHNVTLYGQRDACFDTWNVVDVSVSDLMSTQLQKAQNETIVTTQTKKVDELTNACQMFQPAFSVINRLTPYTRYAIYVKTYTTLQDRKGAQSPIKYFRTLPSNPSPPTSLTVELLSPHSVFIKWSPPTMPNGTITLYLLQIRANTYNRAKILSQNLNYCANPTVLSNMITVRNEDNSISNPQEDKSAGDLKNTTCSCEEEIKQGSKFNSRSEAERIESIDFENYLQNVVYTRKEKVKSKNSKTRSKRSTETISNSMLVIVNSSDDPAPGFHYTNVTDGRYAKTLFYELNGNARSLSVENLRHFTWYSVNIWACRAKQSLKTEESDPESDEAYAKLWCSDRASYNFRTLELLNADVVNHVRAELALNKTLPEVNVTWDPPANPNGFVVAYTVHHKRVEDNGQSGVSEPQSCMTVDEFETGGRSFVLRNLAAGNYSVRVTPLTVRGAGNVSSHVYIFIPEKNAESGYEWVWGVVGGGLIVILVLVAVVWYAKRELLPSGEANKLIASVNPEYVSTMYVPDEWEVPREYIKLIKELGQGSFGMVYEGIAKNIEKGKPETRCAIKTVNEHATDRERIEFLNEASVMKAFDTFHVVRLLGVVSRTQPTLVVMELMELGDLKTYLRSHRPDVDAPDDKQQPNPPPTLQNILQMAIEIADGMAYLSAKKFVHRDLAARNCMVAGDLTVKVGDFGMTRDIYETDYYRKGSKGLLPVRWMSPESLKDGVFSSCSDVWSYGVVLWEMATLAMQPYQGLSNEQVVRYVGEGGVMERPEHCPDRLYELMRLCWAHRPVARPSFLRLVADLAPAAAPHFRHRSFFHSPQGQEFYALQRTSSEDEQDMPEVNVGAVATGSGSNLFGVSGRLASWVRELSSLRSRADDAAAEPLQPLRQAKPVPGNGALRHDPQHGC